MDLLADADGALQALDGDLTGEETLDDLDDEEGVFLVELPGGDDGFALFLFTDAVNRLSATRK